jgi:hypothetical protein
MIKEVTGGLMAALVLLAGVPAVSQHAHRKPEPAVSARCAAGAKAALQTVAAAKQRLELARQTNSASELRSAVADLQAALDALEQQLEPCR